MRALVVLGALLLCAGTAHAQRIALVDRIVAVVNKEVVTASELRERVELAERELRRQNTPLPERPVLERQVLERLIVDKAQLQLAGDSGIRIDEVQLDRAIERIADNNKMTLAQFRQVLEQDGVAFDRFRDEVRRQIVLQRLREREVDERIEVSETEIDLYLEEHKVGGPERVEYNVAHILLRLPEQASPERIEQMRARAERARGEAHAGGDFARLAASYSDAGDALQGGQMGWRAADRLPELFAAALAKLKPGEVSEVLRSPGGFHILKLLDRRGAAAVGGPAVAQTRARHILVRTSETVSEADAQRRLTDLRQRIVNGGADFAELARLHSADVASAARGGELGWIFPGDTVPEFERALEALKPRELSQPVKTPFGWHLIEVLERRTASLPPERMRLAARQAIRERKSDEAFQEWVRQLRDRTYVEIRLEEK
jgi:peptidyl-prolyl cis-trans isomerase SurA